MSSHAQGLISPDVGGAAVRGPPEELDDLDDLVVLRRLGQGATGQVYLAEDSVLARPVAIRLIGADPDPTVRQRFLREARAASGARLTSCRRASSSR